MDIKEVMRRQYGPMPVWAWTTLAASVIAGVIIFNRQKKGTTVAAGSGTGQTVDTSGNGFQSGVSTTTTDANGNQITTNYSASGPNSFLPGQVVQAGGMPYTSGGDVYVNTTNPAAPAPQATTNNLRQLDDVTKFNAQTAGGSPWYMTVANQGESWKDITARIYGFGTNYASVTDAAAKARVDQVTPAIQNANNAPGSTGNGPAPGSVVFFH